MYDDLVEKTPPSSSPNNKKSLVFSFDQTTEDDYFDLDKLPESFYQRRVTLVNFEDEGKQEVPELTQRRVTLVNFEDDLKEVEAGSTPPRRGSESQVGILKKMISAPFIRRSMGRRTRSDTEIAEKNVDFVTIRCQ